MKNWRSVQFFVEWGFFISILLCIIYTASFLYINNYLPFTFFYEPYDIYADWFNVAYWAYDKGSYDTWTTLYPPLSFVFLKLVSNSACYPTRAFGYDGGYGLAARDCDWAGFAEIWFFFLLNIILVFRSLRKNDVATALPRTACVALGWPMLNGLERGNLMLVAFTFFILAFGPLLKSAKLKWICAGLVVNFKVYLIGAAIAPLLKRRWRWAEGAVLAVIIVYLLSFAILGRGTIVELVANLQNWAALPAVTPLDMWSATTYEALYKLLTSEVFPMAAIIGSRNVDILLILIPSMLHATQLCILAGAAATWFRPEVVPNYRAINFAVMLALISSEAGGYTSAFFMFLTMLEPWRGFGRKVAIILCYILALAADIAIDEVAPVVRDTYFGNSTVIVTAYVKISPFIRPLLIQIVAFSLSLVTIRDVWNDIRQQGWGDRWRFRQDAPLLPWIRRPVQPAQG